jgi:hypothetical protein
MADTKISALTPATTPLAGTEVLPIVQSGTTKKVAVSDLTAGRAISATQVTLTTGSLIVGAAGQGIDFSATTSGSGTMTSELLSDYEEGTFTPTVIQGFDPAVTYTTQDGWYTKIGNIVFFRLYLYMAAGLTRNVDIVAIGGLPFAPASGTQGGAVLNYCSGVVIAGTALPVINTSSSGLFMFDTGGSGFTGLTLTSARPEFTVSGHYRVS